MNNNIFVFGSNREGRHGKGAALAARFNHGAVYGQAEGRQGNSYAIITKELRPGFSRVTLEEIEYGVKEFINYANNHPELTFIVTPIGCGLAGFKAHNIAPFFSNAPHNVELPQSFKNVIEGL